jgi:plasmid maintenance system antidote protein VapI
MTIHRLRELDRAQVFHPSDFIQEELDERGWTLRDLVFRMRRYESERDWAINMLAFELYMKVHEKNIKLGDEMASDLGMAFNVNPQMFLNLHDIWLRGAACYEGENLMPAPSKFVPIVKTRCICRNQGQPDEQGFIVYSPSCIWPGHGVHTKFVTEKGISSSDFTIQ